MKIPPKYRFTRRISQLLSTIEGNKEVITNITVPVEIEENIRRQSILGSALFSARIEGNTLTRGEVNSFASLSTRDKKKVEVANLHRSISHILETAPRQKILTKKDLLEFHRQAMTNILSSEFLGKFRQGHEGIFDSVGNLIYHSPPPSQVDDLIDKLIAYINNKREKCLPIKAILAHLVLEEIHPFVDGSGRVGRLLQLAILTSGGYGMKGMCVTEELIEQNRQSYYRAIEHSQNHSDATEFLELMLGFLSESSTLAKKLLLEKQKNTSPLDLLSPRRREIVETILEHQFVSLDFLHRRFLNVSPRLLSYDLKKLSEEGLVQKIGKTRGALYSGRK